ncbi:MAG: alginate lyase family protein [Limnochordia bacterium]
MQRRAVWSCWWFFVVMLLGVVFGSVSGEDNIFVNPTFADAEEGVPPPGWQLYGVLSDQNTITLVDAADPEKRGLLIVDGSTASGSAGQIGLTQIVAAEPHQAYRLSAKIKAPVGAKTDGASLQLRFLPSSQLYQVPVTVTNTAAFEEVFVEGYAPADTTQAQVFLWTASGSTPQFIVSEITLRPIAGVNLLQNPAFSQAKTIPPPGWQTYGTLGNGNTISFVHEDDPEKRAVLISDEVSIDRGYAGELGLQQTVPSTPGQTYRLSAWVKGTETGISEGAFLQLRFLPSNELQQVPLDAWNTLDYEEIAVEGKAPEGTTSMRVYVYTHAKPTPQFYLREVTLTPIEEKPELVWTAEEVIRGMNERYGELKPGQVVPKVGLYITAADIEHARRLVEEYDWAKRLKDDIVNEADFWVRMSDDWYKSIIPPAGSIFAYGQTGCPVDGSAWANFGGNGVADFSRPYTLRCPNGITINFNDPQSPYYDPGAGITINGRVYYLRGIWNAFVAQQLVGNGSDAIVHKLAHAYALTGEPKYAEKAILILDLLATLSPTTIGPRDFTTSDTAVTGRLHWLTSIVHRAKMRIMNSYDLVYHLPRMQEPSASAPGMTAAENIEQNLIMDYLFGEFDPRGGVLRSLHNHEADSVRAMLGVGLLLGQPDYIRWGLEELGYFLDNTINRDGLYYETSLSYSEFSRSVFLDMIELAYNYDPANYSSASYAESFPQRSEFPYMANFYDHPGLRNFVYGYRERIDAGGFRPAFGNSAMPSGWVRSGEVDLATWQAALRYKERASQPEWVAEYTRWLVEMDISAADSRYDLWALFHARPLTAADDTGIPSSVASVQGESSLLGASALSILRSTVDATNAIEMRGGTTLPHGHDDVLGLNIYSGGYHLTWDIGYGISGSPVHLGWGTRSIAHNLVVVNEGMNRNGSFHQIGPGASVTAFVNGGLSDVVEMDAANHYEPVDNLSRYRRTLIQVETAKGPYLVDLFRVTGGLKHDYSFHARGNNLIYDGVQMTKHPTAWTLDGLTHPQATTNQPGRSWGERILPGEHIKDLGLAGETITTRGWAPEPGNGYAFIHDLYQGEVQSDVWQVTWPTAVGYRIRMTSLLSAGSANAGQSVYSGLGPDLQGRNFFRWLIERRESADGKDIDSIYAHLFEAYRSETIVQSSRPLSVEATSPDAVALEVNVDGQGTYDYILYGGPDEVSLRTDSMEWQGHTAIMRVVDGEIERLSLLGGRTLNACGWKIQTLPAWRGELTDVAEAGRYATTDTILPAGNILAGLTVLFDNPAYLRNSSYIMQGVEAHAGGSVFDLGDVSFDLARAHVDKFSPTGSLYSKSPLPTGHAYSLSTGYLNGRQVVVEGGDERLQVSSVPAFTQIQLVKPPTTNIRGLAFAVKDIQPGDTFTIHNVVELEKVGEHSWQVRISAPTTIEWPFAVQQAHLEVGKEQIELPVQNNVVTLDPVTIGAGAFILHVR